MEFLEAALISVGIVFVLRTFIAEPFMVNGSSMTPSFHDGDYLFVDRISYSLRSPERGEVVVFHYPKGEANYFLIKRIIGLPHERVVVNRGKVTIFNSKNPEGFVPDENYVIENLPTSGAADVVLKDGEYFVMGDNRPVSYDSRSWGVLKKDEIVGMARLRIWPPKSMMVFASPEY